MPSPSFANILKKIRPYTDEITLHLMGEPLAHPDFLTLLNTVEQEGAGIKITLTTNGLLIPRYTDALLNSKSIRQINFSIQSYYDNFPEKDINPYLDMLLAFTHQANQIREDLYINFRLWNLNSPAENNPLNTSIMQKISQSFNVELNEKIDVRSVKSKKIINKIYFHFDSRFTWPSLALPKLSEVGTCHGLSGHIGIHADGTVVPCCLDQEAILSLGNLNTTSFEEIYKSIRAQSILKGFRQKKLVEELCQKCPYIKRFQ